MLQFDIFFFNIVFYVHTDSAQNYASMGVCRTESLNIQLEVPPGQSSGLAVHEENGLLVISHVATQSPAYRYFLFYLHAKINMTSHGA